MFESPNTRTGLRLLKDQSWSFLVCRAMCDVGWKLPDEGVFGGRLKGEEVEEGPAGLSSGGEGVLDPRAAQVGGGLPRSSGREVSDTVSMAVFAFNCPLIMFGDPPVMVSGAPRCSIMPIGGSATPVGVEGGEEMVS